MDWRNAQMDNLGIFTNNLPTRVSVVNFAVSLMHLGIGESRTPDRGIVVQWLCRFRLTRSMHAYRFVSGGILKLANCSQN